MRKEMMKHSFGECARDGRLDLLRVLLIASVVCIHTFCTLDLAVYPQYRTASLALNVVFHYAVPLFVMISGAVLMDRADEPLVAFYGKRFSRIFVPLVPCAIFFSALRILRDGDSAALVLREALFGRPYYHLWFAFMLLGVYALMPFLARLVREVNHVALMGVCALLVYVAWRMGEGPYCIVPYAAYAVFGMILYRRHSESRHPWEALLSLFLLVVVTLWNFSIVFRTGSLWTIGYCSPFVFVGSAAFLVCSLQLPRSLRLGGGGSSAVYGVYLWHPVFKGIAAVLVSRLSVLNGCVWLVFPTTLVLSFSAILLLSRFRPFAVLFGVKGLCWREPPCPVYA